MKRLSVRAAAVVLVCTASVGVSQESDSRLLSAFYSADEIYRLRGREGFLIDLQFEAGESFVGLGSGDLGGLVFSSQGNHLFIKPRAAHVVTNLTVLTNRRHYYFDYSTVNRADGAMYALRFTYPPTIRATTGTSAREIAAKLASASVGNAVNRDYWYCGAQALRPVAAWDDGVQTRIRFNPRSEQPAIFVRNPDDTESLLNYNMDGADVVIQRVAQRLVLRRGELTGCVVNKGFSGSGDRLQSGTVSSTVERLPAGSTP